MSGWSLRFGDVDFSPAAQDGGAEFRVYGLKRGKPVPVVAVVDSLLRDGAAEVVDRYDPRDQSIIVGIWGGDPEERRKLEVALALEVQRGRNELSWTPADEVAATTVFEVLWSDLAFDEDGDWDLVELQQCETVYTVTFRAQPFGMSAAEVVDVALTAAAVPATSTIADGTSATGWTSVDGTVTASGGVLHVPSHLTNSVYGTYTDQQSGGYVFSTRTDTLQCDTTKALSAFNFATYPYTSLDLSSGTPTLGSASAPFGVVVTVDGAPAPIIASQSLGPKSIRVTFLSSDSSASTLRVRAGLSVGQTSSGAPMSAAGCEFQVDNVVASNTPPASSTTGRETLRSITIQGSARTSGSMTIEHETAALGDVIVYSRPALTVSSTPNMRRFRTSGNTTPTTPSGTVSGAIETLGNSTGSATVFQPPATTLPRGGYLVYARVASVSGTVSRTLTMTAATVVGSTTVGLQTITSDAVTLTSGNYQFVPIGELVLPPADVPDGSSALLELRLWASTAGSVSLDEVFVFYVGEGSSLTIVRAGDAGSPALGTAHNRLWLDAPSLARPEYSIWLGTQADRSDAFFGGQFADGWGTHQLPAGEALFFLVNTGTATYPKLSVTHRPRWWLHALRTG